MHGDHEATLLGVAVEQRQTGVDAIVLTELQMVCEVSAGVGEALVRQHDALGQTRRTGGVHDRHRRGSM